MNHHGQLSFLPSTFLLSCLSFLLSFLPPSLHLPVFQMAHQLICPFICLLLCIHSISPSVTIHALIPRTTIWHTQGNQQTVAKSLSKFEPISLCHEAPSMGPGGWGANDVILGILHLSQFCSYAHCGVGGTVECQDGSDAFGEDFLGKWERRLQGSGGSEKEDERDCGVSPHSLDLW